MTKIIHRFSPSTGGWYPSNLAYNSLPDDLVDATDEQYQARLDRPDSVFTVENGKLKITVAAAPSLDTLKCQKVLQLRQAYQQLKTSPVKFKTAAKVQATFPNTAADKADIASVLGAGAKKEWTANCWLDVDGNVITPFTFADVKGLSAAMNQLPDYEDLLKLIAHVQASKTNDAVAAFDISSLHPKKAS